MNFRITESVMFGAHVEQRLFLETVQATDERTALRNLDLQRPWVELLDLHGHWLWQRRYGRAKRVKRQLRAEPAN